MIAAKGHSWELSSLDASVTTKSCWGSILSGKERIVLCSALRLLPRQWQWWQGVRLCHRHHRHKAPYPVFSHLMLLCSHDCPRDELAFDQGKSWWDISKSGDLEEHLLDLPGRGRVVLIYRFTHNHGGPPWCQHLEVYQEDAETQSLFVIRFHSQQPGAGYYCHEVCKQRTWHRLWWFYGLCDPPGEPVQ